MLQSIPHCTSIHFNGNLDFPAAGYQHDQNCLHSLHSGCLWPCRIVDAVFVFWFRLLCSSVTLISTHELALRFCGGFLHAPPLCAGIHRRCGTCMSTPTSHRVHCHSIQAIKLDVATMVIVFECIANILSMCENLVFAIELQTCVCRVDDYWLGYKLFCYAYYAHSFQHEAEFRQSKLGWWIVQCSLLLQVFSFFGFPSACSRRCVFKGAF